MDPLTFLSRTRRELLRLAGVASFTSRMAGATSSRPNIDRIGERGTRFVKFYANAPECTPTRTALLTGRYRQRVGELDLPQSEITLATMLKKHNYNTAIFGKWRLGYPRKFWPHNHGFDESFGILGGADYFTRKENTGRPALYQNGKIIELQSMGAGDNTIVIFASDNGADRNGRNAPLRGPKSTLWEGGIRAPCVIRWPSVLGEGKTTDQLAMTVDLAPTVLAAAGAAPSHGLKLDGVNLLPALRGETKPFLRTLLWRYKRGESRRKAVRDGDLKYVNDSGNEEMFDLANDELEQKNLPASDPGRADNLKAKLPAWEKDVEAPRLRDFPR